MMQSYGDYNTSTFLEQHVVRRHAARLPGTPGQLRRSSLASIQILCRVRFLVLAISRCRSCRVPGKGVLKTRAGKERGLPR